MKSFAVDLILSGLTYVILTYLTFVLMRKRKNNRGDDGGDFHLDPPKIDLPPGVVLPNSPYIREEEEVLA